MAEPYRRRGSRYWWIAPVVDGIQQPQSTGETDFDAARKMLQIIEGDAARGIAVGERVPLFRELLETVRRDYRIKGRRSLYDLEKRLDKHLIPALGTIRAGKIGENEIAAYIERRQQEGAKNGTVNRELAIIKRAFSLERRRIPNAPRVELLPEDNARETFFSDAQFASILRHSNPLLRDILTIYGYTGWRRSSVLALEWRQVDLDGGWVFLEAAQTKNRKSVKFPLVEGLLEIFERRKRETELVAREQGRIIPWVFHRKGNRVRSIRTAFENARANAGVPGHVIHDFRRTAVRTLFLLGYDVKTIKDLCGFKSFVMVERYIGMSPDERLVEAGAKLAERRATIKHLKPSGTGEGS